MQLVLLSGGSGKRLWPLSNNARSIQFLPLLEKEDGTMESMVQRVVRQARALRLAQGPTIDFEVSMVSKGFKTLEDTITETLKLLKHMKLLRFTSASMWIMKEVFGLEDEYLLCEPNEDAGRFLLEDIMQAGNFGHHDERLKNGRYRTSRVGLMWAWMKHNLRLIKHYSADVLWTPIGILRISLWRRWHYRNEIELKNI